MPVARGSWLAVGDRPGAVAARALRRHGHDPGSGSGARALPAPAARPARAAGVPGDLPRALPERPAAADAPDRSRASIDGASIPAEGGARRRPRRSSRTPPTAAARARSATSPRVPAARRRASRPERGRPPRQQACWPPSSDVVPGVRRGRGRPRRRPRKLHGLTRPATTAAAGQSAASGPSHRAPRTPPRRRALGPPRPTPPGARAHPRVEPGAGSGPARAPAPPHDPPRAPRRHPPGLHLAGPLVCINQIRRFVGSSKCSGPSTSPPFVHEISPVRVIRPNILTTDEGEVNGIRHRGRETIMSWILNATGP